MRLTVAIFLILLCAALCTGAVMLLFYDLLVIKSGAAIMTGSLAVIGTTGAFYIAITHCFDVAKEIRAANRKKGGKNGVNKSK